MKADRLVRKLGDIIFVQSGFAFKSSEYSDKGHFLVRIANVQDGYLSLDKPKFVTLDSKTSRFELRENDILTSLTGNVGRVAKVEAKHLPAALNQRVARLTLNPDAGVDAQYLLRFLHSDTFFKFLEERAHGTAQANVSPSVIGEVPILVPPLEEQQRIVAVLDEAFEGLARARANIDANLQNARELFERQLAAFFHDTPPNWTTRKLSQITNKVGSGATPKGGAGAYKAEGISLIRSLNVHDRRFKRKNLAFIDDNQAEKLSNVVVTERDVLLNITGASIARCCVVPTEYLPARVNQHVSIIRPDHSILVPEFLALMLTSQPYKDGLLKTGEDNGSTRQALTKALVLNLDVSFPSDISQQEEIISVLEIAEGKSQELAQAYQAKLQDIADLRQSLLQRAFAGELT